MFDLNQILSAALNAAVAEAIKPLVDRIAALESDAFAMRDSITALENNPAIGTDTVLAERITALETKLTEAKLFEQTTHVQTLMSPEMIVDSLNNAEWLWEKINAYIETGIEDRIERAIDDHCSTYDHDDYDSLYGDWSDYDPATFVSEDTIEEKVNDTLRNASFEIRVL